MKTLLRVIKFLLIGILVLIVPMLFNLASGATMHLWPEESVDQVIMGWDPPQELIEEEIAALTGPWIGSIKYGSAKALAMETFVFLIFAFWRAGGLMLIGMALYKMGVLTAKRTRSFYMKGWLISWIIGLALVCTGV